MIYKLSLISDTNLVHPLACKLILNPVCIEKLDPSCNLSVVCPNKANTVSTVHDIYLFVANLLNPYTGEGSI